MHSGEPKAHDILAQMTVGERFSAACSALARCASDTNFDRICLYLNRLPTEFRVLCVRDATLRAPAIRTTAGYTKWAVENHHAIA